MSPSRRKQADVIIEHEQLAHPRDITTASAKAMSCVCTAKSK